MVNSKFWAAERAYRVFKWPDRIDGNTICWLFFLPEGKNKTQLSLSRRACEIADDVS